MKHGKKPNRAQKKFIQSLGLDPKEYLVCRQTDIYIILEEKSTERHIIYEMADGKQVDC